MRRRIFPKALCQEARSPEYFSISSWAKIENLKLRILDVANGAARRSWSENDAEGFRKDIQRYRAEIEQEIEGINQSAQKDVYAKSLEGQAKKAAAVAEAQAMIKDLY